MDIVSKEDTAIIENLKDAGCSDGFIHDFFHTAIKPIEQLTLLSKYRGTLLQDLHQSQKRIDCLDYLICKIKKQEAKENGNDDK